MGGNEDVKENVYKIEKLTITVIEKNEPSEQVFQGLNKTLERLFDEQEEQQKEKGVIPTQLGMASFSYGEI
jgi:hypothetical protein